ncbi:MAG: tetratricopeptide repeat protein [Parachlamydia sp.]|nr:tetratricopeptide repeat protein [Parachlamydia sp.]
MALVAERMQMFGQELLNVQEWALAAQIFNAALAVCIKAGINAIHQSLLDNMTGVVKRLIVEEKPTSHIPVMLTSEPILARRAQLSMLRKSMSNLFDQGKSSQECVEQFSKGIQGLVTDLLNDACELLGKPPCEFTVLGLGSLARREMNLYSDLEFAILINVQTEENASYFRKLVKLLEIQVIHLGETQLPMIQFHLKGPVMKSPIKNGFSFDSGGNTPIRKQLIQTPKNMEKLQSERDNAEDHILTNALKETAVLVGSPSLYEDYWNAMREILNAATNKPDLCFRQQRALNLLKRQLHDFAPRIDKEKEEFPVFNIKEELQRLPCFLFATLADYYGIEEENTWDKIDKLKDKQVFSEAGAEKLKKVLNAIMRLRCQKYYEREWEIAYHPSMQIPKGEGDIFVLSDDDVLEIQEIYRTILPLHRAVKEVYATKRFTDLARESFYDDSLKVQAEAHEHLHQYKEAKNCFIKQIGLDPADASTLIGFANLLARLAEYQEAEEYGQKVLKLGEQRQSQKIISNALCLLGLVSEAQGNYQKAFEYHLKGYTIDQEQFGQYHPETIPHLMNLGHVHQNCGRLKEAQHCYEEVLRIFNVETAELQEALSTPTKKVIVFDENHTLALIYHNLGSVLVDSGESEEGIEYLLRALRIKRNLHGSVHPSVATTLNNLGHAKNKSEEYKEALKYFKEALKINQEILGADHPNNAATHNNMGTVYCALRKFQKAREHLDKALRIDQQALGMEHPNVARDCQNLAIVLFALKEREKGLRCFDWALAILKKAYPPTHPKLAVCLFSLGEAYLTAGETDKARENFEAALGIELQINGKEHSHVAEIYSRLGDIWRSQGIHKRAVECYEEVVKIQRKSPEEPDLIVNLANLGTSYHALNQHEEAVQCMEEAKNLSVKMFGEEHPVTARLLRNLGGVLFAQEETEKALECAEKALEIYQKIQGIAHEDLIALLEDLFYAYQVLDEPEKALYYLEEALKVKEQALGKEHDDVAAILKNLAEYSVHIKKNRKAIYYYQRGLELHCKKLGENHEVIGILHNNLGSIWIHEGNFSEAIKCLKKAVAIKEKAVGNDNIGLANSLGMLGNAYKAVKDTQNTIDCFNRRLTILKKVHGESHVAVAQTLNNLGITWENHGNLVKAIECCEKAVSILENLPGAPADLLKVFRTNLQGLYKMADEKNQPVFRRGASISSSSGPTSGNQLLDAMFMAAAMGAARTHASQNSEEEQQSNEDMRGLIAQLRGTSADDTNTQIASIFAKGLMKAMLTAEDRRGRLPPQAQAKVEELSGEDDEVEDDPDSEELLAPKKTAAAAPIINRMPSIPLNENTALIRSRESEVKEENCCGSCSMQ